MKTLILALALLSSTVVLAETLAQGDHGDDPIAKSDSQASSEPEALTKTLPVTKATGKFKVMEGGVCNIVILVNRDQMLSKRVEKYEPRFEKKMDLENLSELAEKYLNSTSRNRLNEFAAAPFHSVFVSTMLEDGNKQGRYDFSVGEAIRRKDFPMRIGDLSVLSHDLDPSLFGSFRSPIVTFDGSVLRVVRFDIIQGRKLIRITEIAVDSNLKAPSTVHYRELEGEDLKTAKPIEGEVECSQALS